MAKITNNLSKDPHCPKCKIPVLIFNEKKGKLYCPICQIEINNKYIILHSLMKKLRWRREEHTILDKKEIRYHKDGLEIDEKELFDIIENSFSLIKNNRGIK